MTDYIRADSNDIGNNWETEFTEKIVNDFKIAIDFYRMEYSEDLRTLFNEFGYLLLCELYYGGYLMDIPATDSMIGIRTEEFFYNMEKELSELSATVVNDFIGLLHSTFQKDIVSRENFLNRGGKFKFFVDFSLSIKNYSVLRQILLVIRDLVSLREMSGDMSAVYDIVHRIHGMCSNSGKADLGRFFLPDKIVGELIGWLVTKTECRHMNRQARVFDPQYGTGNMLAVAKEYFPEADLCGFEDDWMFRISAQILGILSGVDITTFAGKFLNDKLGNMHEIVLANPVFNNDTIPKDAYLQFLPDELKEIKNRYSLFIVRTLQAIAPKGYGIIITPDSFLFSSKRENMAVRRWMLSNYCLEAVISLPEKTFYPHASTKASALLVANHDKSGSGTTNEQTQKVSFYQMMQGAKGSISIGMTGTQKQDDFWVTDINTIREAGWNLLPENYRPLRMRDLQFEAPAVLLEELLREQENVLTDMKNLLEEVRNIE